MQFIATLIIFVILIITAVVIIYIKTKDQKDETPARYFEIKKQQLANSIDTFEFVNIENFIIDYTNPVLDINRALMFNRYVFFPKTFNLPLSNEILIPSNTIIKFSEDMTLVYTPLLTNDGSCLFSMRGVTNVTILGNHLRVKDSPAICIEGSSNVLIMDIELFRSTRNGIIVSGCKDISCMPYSENIAMKNIHIDEPKTTGLLIQSVKSLKVYKMAVKNSNSKVGITISSRSSRDLLDEISIEGLETQRSALRIMPNNKMATVMIKNYETDLPIYMRNSPESGKVRMQNLNLRGSESTGLTMKAWNTSNCIIEVINPKINEQSNFNYVIADSKIDAIKTSVQGLRLIYEEVLIE